MSTLNPFGRPGRDRRDLRPVRADLDRVPGGRPGGLVDPPALELRPRDPRRGREPRGGRRGGRQRDADALPGAHDRWGAHGDRRRVLHARAARQLHAGHHRGTRLGVRRARDLRSMAHRPRPASARCCSRSSSRCSSACASCPSSARSRSSCCSRSPISSSSPRWRCPAATSPIPAPTSSPTVAADPPQEDRWRPLTEIMPACSTPSSRRKIGRAEGGVPIGGALIADDGTVLAVGHNRRVQQDSAIRHGETDALENAGRLPASVYRRSTMYTTLSPCDMCTGAILLYGIPRVVIGREPHVRGRRGLPALARRRGRQPRLAGMRRPHERRSSRRTPRSGTRTSARSREAGVGA